MERGHDCYQRKAPCISSENGIESRLPRALCRLKEREDDTDEKGRCECQHRRPHETEDACHAKREKKCVPLRHEGPIEQVAMRWLVNRLEQGTAPSPMVNPRPLQQSSGVSSAVQATLPGEVPGGIVLGGPLFSQQGLCLGVAALLPQVTAYR